MDIINKLKKELENERRLAYNNLYNMNILNINLSNEIQALHQYYNNKNNIILRENNLVKKEYRQLLDKYKELEKNYNESNNRLLNISCNNQIVINKNNNLERINEKLIEDNNKLKKELMELHIKYNKIDSINKELDRKKRITNMKRLKKFNKLFANMNKELLDIVKMFKMKK